MRYSAIVKDKFTGEYRIFENMEYKNKANCVHDLRRNGYIVNEKKVKRADVFSYIMNHTNAAPWDWELTKVPNE